MVGAKQNLTDIVLRGSANELKKFTNNELEQYKDQRGRSLPVLAVLWRQPAVLRHLVKRLGAKQIKSHTYGTNSLCDLVKDAGDSESKKIRNVLVDAGCMLNPNIGARKKEKTPNKKPSRRKPSKLMVALGIGALLGSAQVYKGIRESSSSTQIPITDLAKHCASYNNKRYCTKSGKVKPEFVQTNNTKQKMKDLLSSEVTQKALLRKISSSSNTTLLKKILYLTMVQKSYLNKYNSFSDNVNSTIKSKMGRVLSSQTDNATKKSLDAFIAYLETLTGTDKKEAFNTWLKKNGTETLLTTSKAKITNHVKNGKFNQAAKVRMELLQNIKKSQK